MAEHIFRPGYERVRAAAESKQAYSSYLDKAFDALEAVSNPATLDLEANELILLVVRHRQFSAAERLLQLSYISHFAMVISRRLADADPQLENQAELIHHAYAEIYSKALVGLAQIERPPDSSASTETSDPHLV